MSGGKKHRKKKKDFETVEAAELIKRERKKKNKKYVLLLIANTIVFMSAYMYLVKTRFMMITLWVYLALTVGFLAAYIIYNRGFPRRDINRDMLSDDLSNAEKDAIIDEVKRKFEKSKWMLTVLIPLIAIYAYEVIDAYVVPKLQSLFI